MPTTNTGVKIVNGALKHTCLMMSMINKKFIVLIVTV